jgi:FkbM family methyltransferase
MLNTIKRLFGLRTLHRAVKNLGFRATYDLIRVRFGRPDREYLVHVRGYKHPIAIRGGNSTDAAMLYQVLARGEYGNVGHLAALRTIIDAGGNIGIASIYFLHRYPDARILTVEPDPDNFELCRKNLAPYGDRVALLHGALWGCDASDLQLDNQAQESCSIRVQSAPPGQAGSVRGFSVGSLIDRVGGVVDLLKIDIEGSEKEVFRRNAEDWLPRVRNLVVELHSEECERVFFNALSGYRFEQRITSREWAPVVFCRNLHPAAS